MPSIRGNITERENILLRRALDPATTENEAAKAMEAFVNSLRKRGLNGYDFVPPDPPRGRAAQEPPPEPPKSEPPPPKYEPKPPPPREETPPWWTRAKEQPPEPPPAPAPAQPAPEPRQSGWMAFGQVLWIAICLIGTKGCQDHWWDGLWQSTPPLPVVATCTPAPTPRPSATPSPAATIAIATPTPSPAAAIFYIGNSYRIHFKNDWYRVGTIRGVTDHIYELPDNPRPWDLYFCKATRDYWVSYLSSDGKQKWLEQPGFWLTELPDAPPAAPSPTAPTCQGSSRSNPVSVHSDQQFYNLKPGTWWRDEAGNEGQK
jgi:hypothetical protein